MHKSLWKISAAAVLVLLLVCCGAAAAHGDHNDISDWQQWSTENELPITTGNYYLGTNVTLSSMWKVPTDTTVNLCLNGHVIKMQNGMTGYRYIEIDKNARLNLYDCNSINKTYYFTVQNDGLWKLDTTKTSGVNLEDITSYPKTNTVIEVTGGCIIDSVLNDEWGDCAVYVNESGTFNMFGGNIVGNTVSNSKSTAGSGGVMVYVGTFNMSGGNIAGNINKGQGGGGVMVYGGTFNMSGGRIVGNTISGSRGGGGVDMWGGHFDMSGGSIIGNAATSSGNAGGVYVGKHGVFTMTGGSIEGNTAKGNGGGVYVRGVIDSEATAFNVSGTPKISGNTQTDGTTANNVHLENGKIITVIGVLQSGAKINITSPVNNGDKFGKADGCTPSETELTYFIADTPNKVVAKLSGTELKWAKVYTITNTTVNGTVTANQTEATEGDIIHVTSYNTTAGYHFDKWNVTKSTGEIIVDASNNFEMPAENVNVGAKFVGNVTNVIFYNQSTKIESKLNTYQTATNTTPEAPTREGYTFVGWNVSLNGGGWADFNSADYNKTGTWNYTGVHEGKLNVYANWTVNTYTITNSSSDPGKGYTEVSKTEAIYTENVKAEAFAHAGYHFVNWTCVNLTDPVVSDNLYSFTMPAKNVELTANFAGNVTVLKLQDKDDNEFAARNETYGEKNATAVSPLPTAEGYTFNGWNVTGSIPLINATGHLKYPVPSYTNESGYWDNSTLAHEAELTLTSSWTANVTHVRFYNETDVTYDQKDYTYEQAVILPENPEKTGYTFVRWNVSDGTPFNSANYNNTGTWNYTGANGGTLEVYANWTANTYNVTFDNNTGTGIMENQTFVYGKAQNLKANRFTKSGYSFAGWATTPNGPVVYVDKQIVNNLIAKDKGIFTLYAVWTANPQPSHSSRSYGASVWLPAVSTDTDGAQITSDITLRYAGTAFIGVSVSTLSALKTANPEIAAAAEIKISTAKAAGIKVTNSKEAPALIQTNAAEGLETVTFSKVYDIKPSNPNEKLTQVTVTVPKADIAASGLTTDDVTIYHYIDAYDIWVPLDTLQITEDEVNCYYTAATDGVSPFGVLIKKFDAAPVSPVSSQTTSPVSQQATSSVPPQTTAPVSQQATSSVPPQTTVPVSQQTTSASPVPVAGIIAGLGAAGVLFALRRK